MKKSRRKTIRNTILFGGLALFIAGCAKTQPDTSVPAEETDKEVQSDASFDSGAAEYPIVIKHAFGETVIESKPERIAAIQWGNQDVVLALGVVPVGFSAANYGVQDDSGLLEWTAAKLKELDVDSPNIFMDTDGLDFEAISDSNPDVILAAYSGITQEDYDMLSKIAPVVAYQSKPWVTTWREQILYNSMGMGMQEEGEQLIRDLEELLSEKAGQYPEMKGKKIAWVNFSETDLSQFHLYTPVDPRGTFLQELGMEYPESILELITDPTVYSLKLSAEQADALNDLDLIIGYGGEELYEAVKADPLLGSIPAIQRGSVVFIGAGTTLAASGTPGPLSIPYTIDEYLRLIGEAIEKINE